MSDSVVDTGHSVSTNDAMEASIISFKRDPEPSAPVINKSPIEFSSRSSSLSNRERLLLRKQALRMKKIPIVPIGIIFSSILFLEILYVLSYLHTS